MVCQVPQGCKTMHSTLKLQFNANMFDLIIANYMFPLPKLNRSDDTFKTCPPCLLHIWYLLKDRRAHKRSTRYPTLLFRQFSANFLKLVPKFKVCSSDYFLFFELILLLFLYYPGKLRIKIPE